MAAFFNKKDMLSFGEYLVSKERFELIVSNPNLNKELLEETISSVSHADWENWLVIKSTL